MSHPATPAALARVDGSRLPRAAKREFDDLDDDDLVVIGRVVEGRTPRRILRVFGILGGTVGGVAIATLAPAALPLIVAVTVVGTVSAFAFTHSDAVADLKDAGLDDGLAATLGAAAAAEERRLRTDKLTLAITAAQRRAHLQKVGARVVDAARRAREAR